MPILITLNKAVSYGEDFLKFQRGNTNAGLWLSTTDRMILDDRMDRMGNHFGTMMKLLGLFIGIGIMIFLIFIGAQYFTSQAGGASKTSASPASQTLHALLPLILAIPLRRWKDDMQQVQ